MSLNFSFVNCTSTHEERLEKTHEVDSVIWHTMFLGVNDLSTIAKIKTFWTRYVQYNISNGVRVGDLFLELSDVILVQGMTTNASSITDAAFAKTIRTRMEKLAENAFKNAEKDYYASKEDAE